MGEYYKIFNGTDNEYDNLHGWVRKRLGTPQRCDHCGDTSKRRYEWANKSRNYLRDITDWERLCCPCHALKDGRGVKAKEFCKRGHRLSENVYIKPSTGTRECLACKRLFHTMKWRSAPKQPSNKT